MRLGHYFPPSNASPWKYDPSPSLTLLWINTVLCCQCYSAPRGQDVPNRCFEWQEENISDASKVSRDFEAITRIVLKNGSRFSLLDAYQTSFPSPSIVQSQSSSQYFLQFVAQFTAKSTRDKSIQKLPLQVSNCVHGIGLQVNVFCDMFDFTERSIIASSDWVVGDNVRIEL